MDPGLKGKWDDPVYKQLADRLDTVPNGYPATESGVERRLLAKLFTPGEAATALHLKLVPEPAAQIAERTGDDPQQLEAVLAGMSERGLIHEKRRKDSVTYALLPFVVGIYELQLDHMDQELAEIFEEYYREGFHGLLEMTPAIQRVIPVEENVPSDVGVMSYERASELLGEAQSWGVMDCICRKQKHLIGEPCEHPVDVCMMLSRRPGTFDGTTTIRALTREEALGVLRRAAEAGLVHTVGNQQRGIYYVCNCCSCSCAILRGVAEYGILSATAPSSLQAEVDDDACVGCELCVDRCQFGALSVEDGLCGVDELRCFGCGQCIMGCEDGAIRLIPRPGGATEPPESMPDWIRERAEGRDIDIKRLEEVIGRLN